MLGIVLAIVTTAGLGLGRRPAVQAAPPPTWGYVTVAGIGDPDPCGYASVWSQVDPALIGFDLRVLWTPCGFQPSYGSPWTTTEMEIQGIPTSGSNQFDWADFSPGRVWRIEIVGYWPNGQAGAYDAVQFACGCP